MYDATRRGYVASTGTPGWRDDGVRRRRVPLAGGTTGYPAGGSPRLAGTPLAGGTTGSPGWRDDRVPLAGGGTGSTGRRGSPPAGGSTGSPGWRVDGYPAGGSPRLAGRRGPASTGRRGPPRLAGRRGPLAGGSTGTRLAGPPGWLVPLAGGTTGSGVDGYPWLAGVGTATRSRFLRGPGGKGRVFESRVLPPL